MEVVAGGKSPDCPNELSGFRNRKLVVTLARNDRVTIILPGEYHSGKRIADQKTPLPGRIRSVPNLRNRRLRVVEVEVKARSSASCQAPSLLNN